ncbi:MAG: hypothetical protein KO318_04265, partial [Methanobacterium sp.]|uniref:hypothetical protein n=1 Tax=Methanobacterium sp. TaxID=2164 RepID=UPI0025830377
IQLLQLQPTTTKHPNLQIRQTSERYHQITHNNHEKNTTIHKTNQKTKRKPQKNQKKIKT